MALDYIALAQWGLVPALGVLTGITLTYSYKIFYKQIIEKEDDVKTKVKNDVISKINQVNPNPSTNQGSTPNINIPDEQEFANELGRIAKFKELVKDGKDMFRKSIIFSATGLILSGIIYVVWESQRNAILVLGAILLIIHLLSCNSLRINYDMIERFLNNEDPKKILGEES